MADATYKGELRGDQAVVLTAALPDSGWQLTSRTCYSSTLPYNDAIYDMSDILNWFGHISWQLLALR